MASQTVCAVFSPPQNIGAISEFWVPYSGPSLAKRRCRKNVIARYLYTPAPYCPPHPHELKVRTRPRDDVRSTNTVLCVVFVGHTSVSVRIRVHVPLSTHSKN